MASSRDFCRALLETLAVSEGRIGRHDHIRDLRLNAYLGGGPRKRIALRRRSQPALRAGRVRVLCTRRAPGRRRFARVYPQQIYGVQQFGLSPTAVRTLRRQAARAWSTLGQGRCLTSALALELGDQDPGKRIVG